MGVWRVHWLRPYGLACGRIQVRRASHDTYDVTCLRCLRAIHRYNAEDPWEQNL